MQHHENPCEVNTAVRKIHMKHVQQQENTCEACTAAKSILKSTELPYHSCQQDKAAHWYYECHEEICFHECYEKIIMKS